MSYYRMKPPSPDGFDVLIAIFLVAITVSLIFS